MGKARPGWGQVGVLYIEPTRAAATAGFSVMALLMGAVTGVAMAYRTERWPEEWRLDTTIPDSALAITAAVAGGLCLLLLLAAVVNGRRWRTSRRIERLSEDPALVAMLPDPATGEALAPARRIPPLTISVVKPRKLPRPPAKLRRITAAQNLVGHRPLEIAYLRLFENQPRTRTFFEGAWREFGYVSMLRSAASVTPAEYRAAKRSKNLGAMFIATHDELRVHLDHRQAPLPKGRYAFKSIAGTTIRVRDRYGSYPPRALLCHGRFWKAAVDMVLDRVDLVALDLSGFRPDNLGTRYELQRVVDRFPIERVVLLADERSNMKFLRAQVEQAWSQMAAGSPNEGTAWRQAIVAVTDHFATSSQDDDSSVSQVRLVSRRSETRRVAAMAQDRVDSALGPAQW